LGQGCGKLWRADKGPADGSLGARLKSARFPVENKKICTLQASAWDLSDRRFLAQDLRGRRLEIPTLRDARRVGHSAGMKNIAFHWAT